MKFSTADDEWHVETAELTLADHSTAPNLNGERLVVTRAGYLVGNVYAHRTPAGDMLDAATLAELARLGVPLDELIPDPLPRQSDSPTFPPPPATPAARNLRALPTGE